MLAGGTKLLFFLSLVAINVLATQPNFDQLVPDIVQKVFDHLEPSDGLNLGRVSRFFKAIASRHYNRYLTLLHSHPDCIFAPIAIDQETTLGDVYAVFKFFSSMYSREWAQRRLKSPCHKYDGKNPVQLAVQNGNVPFVQFVIDENLYEPMIWTALIHESNDGNLQEKPRLMRFVQRSSKLLEYISDGLHDMATALLSESEPISVNFVSFTKYDHMKRTLQYAVASENADIVAMLLKRNVLLNQPDAYGSTALHYAAELGDNKTTVLLLQAGANVNATDVYLQSPLHQACLIEQNDGTIRSLLKYYADVNAQDYKLNTPLHYAVISGESSVVSLLLQHGAKCTQNRYRETPLGIAIEMNNEHAVSMLRRECRR